VEMDVEWDAVLVDLGIFGGVVTAVSAGSDTLYAWSIRRQTQTGSSVAVEVQVCGGTASDLCSPYFQEPYQQYVPDSIYELASMPKVQATMTLSDPDPGDPFQGPLEASLQGLDLAN